MRTSSRAKTIIHGLTFVGDLPEPSLYLQDALAAEGIKGHWTILDESQQTLAVKGPPLDASSALKHRSNIVTAYFRVPVSGMSKGLGDASHSPTIHGDLTCVYSPDNPRSRYIYVHEQSPIKPHLTLLIHSLKEAIIARELDTNFSKLVREEEGFTYPPDFNPYTAAVKANDDQPLLTPKSSQHSRVKASSRLSRSSSLTLDVVSPSSKKGGKKSSLSKNSQNPSLELTKNGKSWSNVIYKGDYPATEQHGNDMFDLLNVKQVRCGNSNNKHGYLFGTSLNVYITAGSFMTNKGSSHTARAKAAYFGLSAVDHLNHSSYIPQWCSTGAMLNVSDADTRAWKQEFQLLIQSRSHSRPTLLSAPLTPAGSSVFTLTNTDPHITVCSPVSAPSPRPLTHTARTTSTSSQMSASSGAGEDPGALGDQMFEQGFGFVADDDMETIVEGSPERRVEQVPFSAEREAFVSRTLGTNQPPNIESILDQQTNHNINNAFSNADPPLSVNWVYSLREQALAHKRTLFNKLSHTGPPPTSDELTFSTKEGTEASKKALEKLAVQETCKKSKITSLHKKMIKGLFDCITQDVLDSITIKRTHNKHLLDSPTKATLASMHSLAHRSHSNTRLLTADLLALSETVQMMRTDISMLLQLLGATEGAKDNTEIFNKPLANSIMGVAKACLRRLQSAPKEAVPKAPVILPAEKSGKDEVLEDVMDGEEEGIDCLDDSTKTVVVKDMLNSDRKNMLSDAVNETLSHNSLINGHHIRSTFLGFLYKKIDAGALNLHPAELAAQMVKGLEDHDVALNSKKTLSCLTSLLDSMVEFGVFKAAKPRVAVSSSSTSGFGGKRGRADGGGGKGGSKRPKL
jgi:hypothetical protein